MKPIHEYHRDMLRAQFDIEVHLGSQLYSQKVDWSRAKYVDGHDYVVKPTPPLFSEEDLNELERLSMKTKEKDFLIGFDKYCKVSSIELES